ncbi:DnaD domain protein [Brevibacillus sp. TJ4]|uniref:DnaD domain protein n=1 Tax=Brevibacillus sp. TJ4 TaxID=3234853 RepID=UPI0037D59E59
MNYIRELNAFIDWLEINPLEAITQTLWFHLMAIANKSGWPEWFTVANLTLQAKLNVSENTLNKHRNLLVQKGRIEYRSQGKHKAGKYRIISFSSTIVTAKNEVDREVTTGLTSNFAADREVIREVNLAVNREVNHAALYKLNETKQNETDISLSTHEREDFLPLINELDIKCRGVRDIEELESYIGLMETDLIREALKRAEKKSVAYALRILKDWNTDKIHTVQKLRELELPKGKPKTKGNRNNVVPMDKLPASVQWQMEQQKTGGFQSESKTIEDYPDLARRLQRLREG